MTPSKDLFELIKSLSKAEKAHFNRYSQLHASGDQKSYQLLFDAIGQQEEYDEKKLYAQFQEHGFVRYFPSAKNYLYSRIMDSLENFYRDMSVHAQVRSAIHRAEILQKKGLLNHSVKALKKAKKDATEAELHYALLDIATNFEHINASQNTDFIKSEHINNNILKISSDLKHTTICSNSSSRMFNIYCNYLQTRNKKYLQDADKAIQDPYFREAAKTQTFRGKHLVYESFMFYWYIKGKMDLASHYAKKGLEHYYSHPAQLKVYYLKYIGSVNNFFLMGMERKNYNEAHIALKKFNEVFHLAKTHSQKTMFYYYYSRCLLNYLYTTGNIREIKIKLPVILKDIDAYQGDTAIREKILLLANVAVCYFYSGDTKKCIFFLNKMNNESTLAEHPEVQYFWHLLALIAHNDLRNYDMLHYLVQNFYRFLLKKKEMSIMEKSIIAFLRKVIRAESEQKITEEFKNFKKTLLKIENDPMYDQVRRTFDIISWLDSKIENRSFTEIVKEKGKLLVRMSSAA